VIILVGVSIWGLAHSRDSATFNNAAFALFHVTILLTGAWPALRPPRPARVPGSDVVTAEGV
jgi:hypothetical protein